MPGCRDWLEARVAAAVDRFSDHITKALRRYSERQLSREAFGIPTLAVIGHGRAGKDESGKYIGDHSILGYGGSISKFMLPMIAYGLEISEVEAWDSRHSTDPAVGREYWYNWCNAFRRQDPLIMLKIVLGDVDIVTGIRGREEFFHACECGILDHTLWLERPGNPQDATMGYTREEALAQENVTELVNDGSVKDLHEKLKQYMYTIKVPYIAR